MVTFNSRNVLFIIYIYMYRIIYGKRALVIFVRKIKRNRFTSYDNSSTTCRATLSHELIIYINLYIHFI